MVHEEDLPMGCTWLYFGPGHLPAPTDDRIWNAELKAEGTAWWPNPIYFIIYSSQVDPVVI